MSLPEVSEVRKRIETVDSEVVRVCLKAMFLLGAARVCEVCGLAYGSEKAYGSRSEDLRLDDFADQDVAIFTMRTAKRGGRERLIGLPVAEKYEPWTRELCGYFQKASGFVFPFHRQWIWRRVTDLEIFTGLSYPIETYVIYADGEVAKKVDKHQRNFKLHALRHLRTTELVEYYGFDAFNLATYGGWTIKSMVGFGGSFDRYLGLSWQSYFPKLLKRRM
jgi:hypothetical protein